MTISSNLSWLLTVVNDHTALALIDKNNHKLKRKNYYVSQCFVEANKDKLRDATHLNHNLDCRQLLVVVN